LGKSETISSKVRNKIRVFTLSTVIQHSLRISSQSKKVERRNKRFKIEKEEVNLPYWQKTEYLKNT
jgi:hypothetical protein